MMCHRPIKHPIKVAAITATSAVEIRIKGPMKLPQRLAPAPSAWSSF